MGTSGHGRGKQASRRRGGRILLWTAGLFLLAQVLGGLVLDHWWIRARFPQRADMYARLAARGHTPEIFFLGSSRFGSNINSDVLDAVLLRDLGPGAPRTFNAAVPAGNGTVSERIFNDLLRQGRRPQLVIVEVSPETVARRDNWLNEHALRVLDWRDFPEALLALARNGKILYLFRGRFLPLHLHRYQIGKEALAWLTSWTHPADPPPVADPPVLTWVPDDPVPPALTADAKARMEDAFANATDELRSYQVGGMAAHRLERLLGRCRSLGVAVVLVGVPVSSPLRRAYTPAVNAAFLAYMKELTAQFGCSYSDWRDRLPDEYFGDGCHARPEGAVYFSRRLATGLLVPVWQELHDD